MMKIMVIDEGMIVNDDDTHVHYDDMEDDNDVDGDYDN